MSDSTLPRDYTTFATHSKAHLDEIGGIWEILRFGGHKYRFPYDPADPLNPEKMPKVVFWPDGGEAPDGLTAEQWENRGVLPIGTGRGRFDEHPVNGNAMDKKGECAATLIARDLGIRNMREIKHILDFIREVDLHAVAHPFDLSSLVKAMHQRWRENPWYVVNWAMEALDAKYEQAIHFSAAIAEIEKKGVVEKIVAGEDTYNILVIETENVETAKAARSGLAGSRADVIIQKQPSSGSVQVLTDLKSGVPIEDAARILRAKEAEAKRMRPIEFKLLGAEGSIEGIPEWFYHKEGRMLLNGAISAPGVPVTRLSLPEILEAVKVSLDPSRFVPTWRNEQCRAGKCTSTRSNPCPWYNWGLARCRTIRYEQYHRDKGQQPESR